MIGCAPLDISMPDDTTEFESTIIIRAEQNLIVKYVACVTKWPLCTLRFSYVGMFLR